MVEEMVVIYQFFNHLVFIGFVKQIDENKS